MFTQISDANYKTAIAETTDGILLGFKPLCPHCKNMEKVLEKFKNMYPNVSFLALDTTTNPVSVEELGVERAPTIVLIKNGAVVLKKASLMNPRELEALYRSI